MTAPGRVRPRTAPELATLLLELGRLIRARRFYPPGDARLATLFERSLRAWRADLERQGPLDLELLPEGFREAGGRGVLSHPGLTELQRDLAERGVSRLCFDASLDGEAFAGFAEVLATDSGKTMTRGGFAAALYAHTPAGIRVNGISPAEAAPPPPPPAEAPEASVDPLEWEHVETELSSTDDLREAPPSHDLGVLLRQLDECESNSGYQDLARRTVRSAERAWSEGRHDEVFPVFVRLASHADGKTEDHSRELAQSFLGSLVQGERLEYVIRRALRGLEAADLDASQVLLAVGGATVPALLDVASSLERGVERDRLAALVVTFGERALPVILERLAAQDTPQRLRAVIRVAGELQHPDVVPALGGLLDADERNVREEALRALVRVGSNAAIGLLARALDSSTPGLALSALHGLGSTGSARAVGPLAHALDQALEARDVSRGKEVIRTLGRIGRPEAGRALVSLLERRVRFGGGWLRELKSAAVTALAGIPGDEAVAALAQAAQARDTQLRRAAQTALDRRAQARLRVGT
jgi:HEAT repeat protein